MKVKSGKNGRAPEVLSVRGREREHGQRIVLVDAGADAEHPIALAISMPDSYYSTDDILLEYGGGLLIAGFREQIVAVTIIE